MKHRNGLLATLGLSVIVAFSGCEAFVGDLETEPVLVDADGDGVGATDCDDNDPSIQTGCAEATPKPDADGDTYSQAEGDCDDGSATVHPNADELCNSIDDDWDEAVDEDLDCDGTGGEIPEGVYRHTLTINTEGNAADADGFVVDVELVAEDLILYGADFRFTANAGNSMLTAQFDATIPTGGYKVTVDFGNGVWLVVGYDSSLDPNPAEGCNESVYGEAGDPTYHGGVSLQITDLMTNPYTFSTSDVISQCWKDGSEYEFGSAGFAYTTEVLDL